MPKAVFRVLINGNDVSTKWKPRVLDIEIVDAEGTTSDTCSVTLADPGGSTLLPKREEEIEVSLGWGDGAAENVGVVFKGKIDEVRSSGGRGQGRTLKISAKGFDSKGKAKEPQQGHADDEKFSSVAKKWGERAGLEIVVDQELGNIQRPYWSIDNESFIHWGTRVASEIGANFKVSAGKGIFTPVNGGKSASGAELKSIMAVWGKNLLNWDIAPDTGRGRFKEVTTRYYDEKEAKWKEKKVSVSDAAAKAASTVRFNAPDEGEADKKSDSGKKKSEKEAGDGTFEIVGDHSARAGAKAFIVGARAGINGEYIADKVTHKYSRSGYKNNVSIKRPKGGAGSDTRSATSANKSSQ